MLPFQGASRRLFINRGSVYTPRQTAVVTPSNYLGVSRLSSPLMQRPSRLLHSSPSGDRGGGRVEALRVTTPGEDGEEGRKGWPLLRREVFFPLFCALNRRAAPPCEVETCALRIAVPSLQSIDCSHQFLQVVHVLVAYELDVVDAFLAGLRTGVPVLHR
jgi:hypothetical protein